MAAKSSSANFLFFFFLVNIFVLVKSWDQVDLELFDIVEEYKDNFYTILGVEPVSKARSIDTSTLKSLLGLTSNLIFKCYSCDCVFGLNSFNKLDAYDFG